ncbi:hypothetical protein ACFPYI_00990 [Halomarina salina]|uniref:ACT domain-containing protein n=1 Tax=Halomarina salina TaxID=1872699 RepID=A0ABD5RHX2_9EURY|nr:hypothetical protein [Halomarina salina]
MPSSPSLAAVTRDAVRDRPFLLDALQAGVLNYAAAARLLSEEVDALDGADEDTVTAALRRFRDELDAYERPRGEARVSMRSGVGRVDGVDGSAGSEEAGGGEMSDAADRPLLRVGDTGYASGGSGTAIVATGEVSPAVLAQTLDRLRAAGVGVEAAAVAGESLVVVVDRRDGPDALRVVEACV